jgi:glucokinase
MMPRMEPLAPVLVADVGGTHTRLAVWEEGAGALALGPTRDGADFLRRVEALLSARRRQGLPPPVAACVAVAGPVEADARGGSARLTNADWALRAEELPLPARLVNDLHAAARGVQDLRGPDGELAGGLRLGGGAPVSGAPLGVIGLGTGLGQALLVGDAVVSGEGGHAGWAPRDAVGDALLRFLRDRLAERAGGLPGGDPPPRVSVERVVSGTALADLLDFAAMRAPLGGEASARLAAEPAAVVVVDCADRDPACALAMELLVAGLGAEAGDLALRALCRGGVALVGGLAGRIAPWLTGAVFRRAFEDKGRMSAISKGIPVWLVADGLLGLRGAAVEARRVAGG